MCRCQPYCKDLHNDKTWTIEADSRDSRESLIKKDIWQQAQPDISETLSQHSQSAPTKDERKCKKNLRQCAFT